MQTTFSNVTIIVDADNPHAAYALLCRYLGDNEHLKFSTDTFSVEGGRHSEEYSTAAVSGVIPDDVARYLHDDYGFAVGISEHGPRGLIVTTRRCAFLFAPSGATFWNGALVSNFTAGDTLPVTLETKAEIYSEDAQVIAQAIAESCRT